MVVATKSGTKRGGTSVAEVVVDEASTGGKVTVVADEAAKKANQLAKKIAAYEAAVERQWADIAAAGDEFRVGHERVELTEDEMRELDAPYWVDGVEPSAEDIVELRTWVKGFLHNPYPMVIGFEEDTGEGVKRFLVEGHAALVKAALEAGQTDSLIFYRFSGKPNALRLQALKMSGGEKGGRSFYEVGLLYAAMGGQADLTELRKHFPNRDIGSLRTMLRIYQSRAGILVTDYGQSINDVARLCGKENLAELAKLWSALDNTQVRRSPKKMAAVVAEVMGPVKARAQSAEADRQLKRIEEWRGKVAGDKPLTVDTFYEVANDAVRWRERCQAAEAELTQQDQKVLLAGLLLQEIRASGVVDLKGGDFTPQQIARMVHDGLAQLTATATATTQ